MHKIHATYKHSLTQKSITEYLMCTKPNDEETQLSKTDIVYQGIQKATKKTNTFQIYNVRNTDRRTFFRIIGLYSSQIKIKKGQRTVSQ